MQRRTVLAGLPALLLAGCTDLLREREVVFRAETATVSEAALAETGYEEVGIRDERVEREFDSVDRTVVVVNAIAAYSRTVSAGGLEGDLGRFTVLSTPKIDVVPGRPANPVGDMDDDDLAETFQAEYDDVGDVERLDRRIAEMLGGDVAVSRYAAGARTEDGQRVDVTLHVAQVESSDDFVVARGVVPERLDERDRIDRLLGGIRHPA